MTKRMTRITVWALAFAMTGVAPLAAQQTAVPPPQSTAPPPQGPQGQVQVTPYVVGQALPPDNGGPRLDLTIDDAVNRALEHNLDLQVAKLNPQMSDYQLQQLRAAFLPTITGSANYNNATSQSTSTIQGGAVVTQNTETYNSGINESLPWQGASTSFSFNNTRSASNASISSFNPSLRSTLQFNFTQPLLMSRSTDATRVGIKTQELTRQITDVQLKTSIANTIAQVREAYWDLRAAIETIEIAKQSLALAQRLVDDNNVKLQVGTLAPLDVNAAKVTVAQQQLQIYNNTADWQQKELILKRLILSGTDDPAFKATINPVERLDVSQVTPDIPAAIALALSERLDLEQQKLQLAQSDLNLKLLHNQLMPTLNASATYGLQGVGGPQLNRAGLTGDVTSVIPGGYLDALSSLTANPTWSAGLSFSFPVGEVAARANLARNELAYQQAKVQIKVTEFTIATDVTNAALAVQNDYLSLQAANVASDYADLSAAAEQSKYEVGLSTNYNVVQAIDTANSQRQAKLSAMITYIKALIEFERLQAVSH